MFDEKIRLFTNTIEDNYSRENFNNLLAFITLLVDHINDLEKRIETLENG